MYFSSGVLTNLAGHECLAGAGWPEEEDPLDVLAAQLLHDLRGKYSGRERAPNQNISCTVSIYSMITSNRRSPSKIELFEH
jgi:hypothetical protein